MASSSRPASNIGSCPGKESKTIRPTAHASFCIIIIAEVVFSRAKVESEFLKRNLRTKGSFVFFRHHSGKEGRGSVRYIDYRSVAVVFCEQPEEEQKRMPTPPHIDEYSSFLMALARQKRLLELLESCVLHLIKWRAFCGTGSVSCWYIESTN